jgi:hypothetical protein
MRAALALLLLLAGLVTTAPPATAQCPRPTITVSPSSATPGQSVTVRGDYFATTCNDAGPPRPNPPARGLELFLVQGTWKTPLAVVDADSHYRINVIACLPASARSGRATLLIERASPADITITPTGDHPPSRVCHAGITTFRGLGGNKGPDRYVGWQLGVPITFAFMIVLGGVLASKAHRRRTGSVR